MKNKRSLMHHGSMFNLSQTVGHASYANQVSVSRNGAGKNRILIGINDSLNYDWPTSNSCIACTGAYYTTTAI